MVDRAAHDDVGKREQRPYVVAPAILPRRTATSSVGDRYSATRSVCSFSKVTSYPDQARPSSVYICSVKSWSDAAQFDDEENDVRIWKGDPQCRTQWQLYQFNAPIYLSTNIPQLHNHTTIYLLLYISSMLFLWQMQKFLFPFIAQPVCQGQIIIRSSDFFFSSASFYRSNF